MKVFFYINVLGGGGAERVVANLANQLAANGETVGVITSFATENEYALDKRVSRWLLDDETSSPGRLKKNISRIRGLRKLIKTEQPDLLVSFMAEPNYRAVLATRGCKTKLIISVRNDPNREYAGRVGNLLGKHLLPQADGCVFQTEDAQKWFPEKLQKKSCIIMNQVAEVFYQTKFEGDRKDIVTVGRLNPQKNHKMLIRSYAKIADQVSDRLIIYGKGELREELESLIEELGLRGKVCLPGATDNVPDTIKGAKLFVLSSDFEGMPNALMEAMALGLPCISTDCPCGGPRMLLGNEENDRLVSVGNEKELAETMLNLVHDEEKLERYSLNSREKAKDFNSDVIYQKWLSYFKQVVM